MSGSGEGAHLALTDPGPLPAAVADPDAVLARLRRSLATLPWPVSLRLNRNRRILISLRGSARRGMRLSIHGGLLGFPAAIDALPQWIRAGGRLTSPSVRAALDELGRTLRAGERAVTKPLELEPLGGQLDLVATMDRIHAQHFAHLPKPAVAWGRGRRQKPTRHVRFATYRSRPVAMVMVSPRLNQPWVARLFIDYVIYHELCHHAQACTPLRGERAHSRRFHAWERGFPGYAQATRWERDHVDRFLA
ncbi:MAG: M48 family metallopeptidase [Planctomycetes bacterium]|nr:M48 family metallopeptidase [Planctomycetota bacterium]